MPKELKVLRYIHEKPLFSISTGLFFLIIGILFSDIPTMIVSQKWPTTSGIITKRILTGQSFKEYDGDVYTKIDGYIRYQYSLDGVSYNSTAINATDSPFYSYDLVIQYPEERKVIVHYNPNDPTKSVLEPGYVYTFQAFGLLSSFFVIGGLYFAVRGSLDLLNVIK